MSEDENRKKKTDIVVSIDRSEELRQIEEENASLKIEKEHLESTLSAIAQKEFQSQCRKFGLSPETSTPEDLKTVMNSERKRAPRSDSSESPSWSQAIGEEREDPRAQTNLGSVLVDNTREGLESTVTYLNYMKSHGTEEQKSEARRLLSIAVKHQFTKNSVPYDAEFSGSLKDILKHPIAIKDEWSDEEKERALKINADILKKRTAWQQKD
jgi:hypothetical protein